jgi:hypothetical protein
MSLGGIFFGWIVCLGSRDMKLRVTSYSLVLGTSVSPLSTLFPLRMRNLEKANS